METNPKQIKEQVGGEEEEERGEEGGREESKTIRRKTFKTWTSSSDALSLDVQTFNESFVPLK